MGLIVKKGEWDFFAPFIGEAMGWDMGQAHTIHFYDKEAWLTPNTQGEAEFTLTKGEDKPIQRTPSIGPRFRQQHVVITVKSKAGKVLHTNKEAASKATVATE